MTLADPNPPILLVDDSPVMRQMLAQLLHHCGLTNVQPSLHGAALETLRAENFRLALVAYGQSGADAADFLGRLRADAALSTLPVIVYGPRSAILEGQEAVGGGANAYLVEPISHVALREKLAPILGYLPPYND